MTKFVGREEEMTILQRTTKKQSASLVVVRGRRRIGKTRLIQEFSKPYPTVYISGTPPDPQTTEQEQRDSFTAQISNQLNTPVISTDRWLTVFWRLAQQVQKGRWIIVLDEISWLGSKDHRFLGELKTAWDLHFSQNQELVLILCGSVSSWIEKNILSSTGFVGRVSIDLWVKELPLKQCRCFWGDRQISGHEILQFLAVTGGVPKYLEEIVPQMSAIDNLRELCFQPNGILFQEFERIFSDLFLKNVVLQKAVVQCLVNGPLTLDSLTTKLGVTKSGYVSQSLHHLALCGFVTEDSSWNIRSSKMSNLKRFRLSDNYLRFYLKFIEPVKHRIMQGGYEPSKTVLSSSLGLQFENLVLNNLSQFVPLLDIKKSDIVHVGPFFQRATKRMPGCQIDLMIQTTYRTLYVCEIKFRTATLGLEVVNSVKEKIRRLSAPKGFSIRPVLIHTEDVSPDVLESEYFDYILDFAELFD